MNFFHHKDLGNHLLQLCPKVMKHPVYVPTTPTLKKAVAAAGNPHTAPHLRQSCLRLTT